MATLLFDWVVEAAAGHTRCARPSTGGAARLPRLRDARLPVGNGLGKISSLNRNSCGKAAQVNPSAATLFAIGYDRAG
ncbi:MAG: hypothetical protein WD069_13075 [Planctomycetales bacterium]